MNYCIVAFGIMLAIAGTTWLFDGRKHYEGPRLGNIQGMEPPGMDHLGEVGMRADGMGKNEE